jgi:hypothetical protein
MACRASLQFITSPSGATSRDSYLEPQRVDFAAMTNPGFAGIDVSGTEFTVNFIKLALSPIWSKTSLKSGPLPPITHRQRHPRRLQPPSPTGTASSTYFHSFPLPTAHSSPHSFADRDGLLNPLLHPDSLPTVTTPATSTPTVTPLNSYTNAISQSISGFLIPYCKAANRRLIPVPRPPP